MSNDPISLIDVPIPATSSTGPSAGSGAAPRPLFMRGFISGPFSRVHRPFGAAARALSKAPTHSSIPAIEDEPAVDGEDDDFDADEVYDIGVNQKGAYEELIRSQTETKAYHHFGKSKSVETISANHGIGHPKEFPEVKVTATIGTQTDEEIPAAPLSADIDASSLSSTDEPSVEGPDVVMAQANNEVVSISTQSEPTSTVDIGVQTTDDVVSPDVPLAVLQFHRQLLALVTEVLNSQRAVHTELTNSISTEADGSLASDSFKSLRNELDAIGANITKAQDLIASDNVFSQAIKQAQSPVLSPPAVPATVNAEVMQASDKLLELATSSVENSPATGVVAVPLGKDVIAEVSLDQPKATAASVLPAFSATPVVLSTVAAAAAPSASATRRGRGRLHKCEKHRRWKKRCPAECPDKPLSRFALQDDDGSSDEDEDEDEDDEPMKNSAALKRKPDESLQSLQALKKPTASTTPGQAPVVATAVMGNMNVASVMAVRPQVPVHHVNHITPIKPQPHPIQSAPQAPSSQLIQHSAAQPQPLSQPHPAIIHPTMTNGPMMNPMQPSSGHQLLHLGQPQQQLVQLTSQPSHVYHYPPRQPYATVHSMHGGTHIIPIEALGSLPQQHNPQYQSVYVQQPQSFQPLRPNGAGPVLTQNGYTYFG